MKRILTLLLLIFLPISMSFVIFDVKPVRAEGIVYIKEDGSIAPPTVPISTVDNYTYVFTNDIYGEIIVQKGNVLIDGNGHTLRGRGDGIGFSWSTINNVTIQNTNVENFLRGIYLNSSSDCAILGNNVTNGICAVYFSNNTRIIGNNITGGDVGVLTLYFSSNFNISGNCITNAEEGIHVGKSFNGSVIGNSMLTTGYIGLTLVGSSYSRIIENNVTKSYIGISAESFSDNSVVRNNVAECEYGIKLDDASDSNLSGNSIISSGYGIWLSSSSNNSLLENNVTDSDFGIWLDSGSLNTLSGNILAGCGLVINDSRDNVVVGNLVNGRPLVYLEGRSDVVVEDAGQVVLINCTRMKVKGLNLSDASVGVQLWGTDCSFISENSMAANVLGGIDLSFSSNNVVFGNSIATSGQAIMLSFSPENTIIGNNITATHSGIDLSFSSDNVIFGNSITTDDHAIALNSSLGNSINGNILVSGGLVINDSRDNVVVGNLVNGRPLVYLEGESDVAVEDAGQVILVDCARIIIENLNLSRSSMGVQLLGTNESVIWGNEISDNYGSAGIQLSSSYENSISENRVVNNENGIVLTSSSDNSITRNDIASNDHGIMVVSSSNDSVIENNMIHNYYAIELSSSSNSIIAKNVITDNEYGIQFTSCSSTAIIGNTIRNNYFGATLEYSSDISVYHNNFVDNTLSAFTSGSLIVWDGGYPLGGNWWSGYNGYRGTDFNSGSGQNETGSDGIGDTEYFIDYPTGSYRDHYPLMGMFSDFDTSLGCSIQAISNSTITDFAYSESNHTVTLLVLNTTASQTIGFCRLTIPRELISPPFIITTNGTEVSYGLISENENLSIIYFSYGLSELEIVVIPELPSFFIVPLFILTALLVITYERRRWSNSGR